MHCFFDEPACGMLPLVNTRVSSAESSAHVISASGWHKAWRVRSPAVGIVYPKGEARCCFSKDASVFLIGGLFDFCNIILRWCF